MLSLIYQKEHTKNVLRIKDVERMNAMKGYVVRDGYMGYVEGRYMLFACEADYRDYMSEE